VIVTGVPEGPEVGKMLAKYGDVPPTNADPFVFAPPTLTTMFPVVVPPGTTATIWLALHELIVVAGVPLNFTVLVP